MSIILSNDCAALVVESANAVALADKSIFVAVDSLAVALGTAPTFEHWEAVANAWKLQYKTKAENRSDEAVTMAWSRVAALLKTRCGLEKPKAATTGAKKKAESRSEAAKVIEAEINKAGGDAVKISEAVANAAKSGDAKKAAVLTKALIKVQNDAGKAAKKAADDAARTKRKAIEAALKTASVEMLEKIAGIISGELVAVKKSAPAKKAAATK